MKEEISLEVRHLKGATFRDRNGSDEEGHGGDEGL